MVRKVAGSNPGLDQLENSLCQPCSKSEKYGVAEGEGWAPPFHMLHTRYSGPLTATAPMAIRLGQIKQHVWFRLPYLP